MRGGAIKEICPECGKRLGLIAGPAGSRIVRMASCPSRKCRGRPVLIFLIENGRISRGTPADVPAVMVDASCPDCRRWLGSTSSPAGVRIMRRVRCSSRRCKRLARGELFLIIHNGRIDCVTPYAQHIAANRAQNGSEAAPAAAGAQRWEETC